MPKDNRKQNPNESTNKYQKHVACSHVALICDNAYVDGDVEVIDRCHITGK